MAFCTAFHLDQTPCNPVYTCQHCARARQMYHKSTYNNPTTQNNKYDQGNYATCSIVPKKKKKVADTTARSETGVYMKDNH